MKTSISQFDAHVKNINYFSIKFCSIAHTFIMFITYMFKRAALVFEVQYITFITITLNKTGCYGIK